MEQKYNIGQALIFAKVTDARILSDSCRKTQLRTLQILSGEPRV
jgi:hypothetical protein